MATRAERAMSFGAIAPEYDRLRPSPPPEAVGWLIPADCRLALDLGAGTGKLSRALAERSDQVVAVEPDPQMAAVLVSRSPGVHVVRGTGEAIPLASGTADGLFLSSAWHWLDPARAIPEIARVLRPGARFGAIWTSRDRQVDWVREIDLIRRMFWPASVVPDDPRLGRPGSGHREVDLPGPGEPGAGLFGHAETASFSFSRTMSVDDLVQMLATYSGFLTASPADQERHLARTWKVLAELFPGATEIDVPMQSRCWRSVRVADQ